MKNSKHQINWNHCKFFYIKSKTTHFTHYKKNFRIINPAAPFPILDGATGLMLPNSLFSGYLNIPGVDNIAQIHFIVPY